VFYFGGSDDVSLEIQRKVRTFPAEEVTSIGREEDPRQVGLAPESIDRIWKSVVDYYDYGLQPAIAICVRRNGAIVMDRAIGHARGNGPDDPSHAHKVAATPDTLFNFFSGSKAVTATLVLAMADRGKLDIDAPVATYIPSFARGGKHTVTIRQVLCHQAGIPSTPPSAIDLELLSDPARIIEALGEMELESAPGTSVAYHAVTGGFLLGEILRVVSGKGPRELLDELITKPLGLTDFGFGVSEDNLHRVAQEVFTGPPARYPFSHWMKRSLGLPFEDAISLANDPRFLQGVVPSGNVIGTARDIGHFFELLLRGGSLNGAEVVSEGMLQRARRPQNGLRQVDRTIHLPVRYGLGFMLGHEVASFYGPRTPAAFGHLGFTNVLGWADPERDISVSLMNNGKPFITLELVHWMGIMRTIAAEIPRDHRTDRLRSRVVRAITGR
jgi:CubicO group peptidase (beta-lactamase class C family)